jgi:hypothetical protein
MEKIIFYFFYSIICMGSLCSTGPDDDDSEYVNRLKKAIRNYFLYHLNSSEPSSLQYLKQRSSIKNVLKIYNLSEREVLEYETIDGHSYVEITQIKSLRK